MRLLLAIGLAALAYAYVYHNDSAWNSIGGPMDDTVWDVRVKPDSWFSFSHKDTLVFDSGHMTAVGYMAAGFPSGAYSASGKKGQCSWQASFQRSNSDIVEWMGRVQDNRIEGDIMQRESSGRVRQLHFKGTRKLS